MTVFFSFGKKKRTFVFFPSSAPPTAGDLQATDAEESSEGFFERLHELWLRETREVKTDRRKIRIREKERHDQRDEEGEEGADCRGVGTCLLGDQREVKTEKAGKERVEVRKEDERANACDYCRTDRVFLREGFSAVCIYLLSLRFPPPVCRIHHGER